MGRGSGATEGGMVRKGGVPPSAVRSSCKIEIEMGHSEREILPLVTLKISKYFCYLF